MIPTRPAGSGQGNTTGGLPTVACPGAEPTTFTLPLTAIWNSAMAVAAAGDGDLTLPVFELTADAAAITPAPAYPLAVEIGLAVTAGSGIVGVPTREQVPASFQVFGVQPEGPGDGGFVGIIILSSSAVSVVGSGDFWLRLSSTDANGCVANVHAYFPDGLPEDPAGRAAPIKVYVFGDDDEPLLFEPANPSANDAEGVATAAQDLAVTTDCGEAPEAVAIALPDCADPIRVAIVSGGGGTTEVTGAAGGPVIVACDGGPLPVALPAPVALVASAGYAVASDADDAATATTAGARLVLVRYTQTAGAVPAVIVGPLGPVTLRPAPSIEHWTIEAPAGSTLPAIPLEVAAPGAGEQAVFEWTAFA